MNDKPKTNKPRVLLIYPPSEAITAMPPLGIGYLGAVLEKEGCEVTLADFCRTDRDWNWLERTLNARQPDFIGLSISTPNYLPAKRVRRKLEQLSPRGKILIGGPHPSAMKKQALEDFSADVAFIGEGEVSVPAYIRAAISGTDLSAVPGLVFKNGDEFVETAPAPFIEDLDSLPFPLWREMDPRRYPPIPHQLFVRRLPVAPVMTTRGCPFNCYYCASTRLFGAKLRKRSIENIIEEIQMLIRDYGAREIHFEDDSFNLSRKHLVGLCQALIDLGSPILWKTPNGVLVSKLDREILGLMKKAGCYQISLGIESLSQQSVDSMGKQFDTHSVQGIIKDAKAVGIQTHGLFILGLPEEEEEQTQMTIRASSRIGLDFAHFATFAPLPGSDYGDQYLKGQTDFSYIRFFTPHYRSEKENKRVKQLQRLAVFGFYFRLKPLWLILKMTKPRQIWGILKAMKRYLLF